MSEKVKKGGPVKRISNFFRELRNETKKIIWPTKKQTFNNTIIVLVVMVLVGAFIAGLDAVMAFAIRLLLNFAGGA